MGRLEDKIAIVTGAGSGIGLAAARRFADEGAHVIGIDVGTIDRDDLPGLVAVQGSVAEPATWDSAVAAADDAGGLDVVFLNAGLYGFDGPIDELPLDLYERTIAANIGGVVLGTRACVPALRARGGGAIVATASVAGLVPFAPNPLYTLTKHAVAGYVAALAPNLVVDNITVDAVCPGVVDTPMTVGALHGADPASFGFTLIAPETIAGVVLDLATTPGTGRAVAVLPGQEPLTWPFPTWGALTPRTAD